MLRASVAAVVAFLLVSASLVLGAGAAHALVACPNGGDGTVGDPCRIGSAADLMWLQGDESVWDGVFEQTADIDMGGTTWSSTIGSATFPFRGTYRGGGHSISGLTVAITDLTDGAAVDAGIFGFVDALGVISDLVVRDISVEVRAGNSASVANVFVFAGALVGDNAGTLSRVQVANASVAAEAEARGFDGTAYFQAFSYVGGLVGRNSGSITDVYVAGSTSSRTLSQASQAHSGGVAGTQAFGGTITEIARAFADVQVTATAAAPEGDAHAGGLIGSAGGSTQVTDSAARGSVTSAGNYVSYAGGVAGSNGALWERVYAAGAVVAESAAILFPGGMFGTNGVRLPDPQTGVASFWDTQTTGVTFGVGERDGDDANATVAVGSTTADMTLSDTYQSAGWDIASGYSSAHVWSWCSSVNDGYPLLSTFFPEDGCDSTSPSDVVPLPTIVVYQALPLPASEICTDVIDTDFAYGTGLSGGWQKHWQMWAGPPGVGGYACVRVLVKPQGKPWRVDNTAL